MKQDYSCFACLRAGKSAKTKAADQMPTPAVPAPAQAKEAAKDGKAWEPAWLHQMSPC